MWTDYWEAEGPDHSVGIYGWRAHVFRVDPWPENIEDYVENVLWYETPRGYNEFEVNQEQGTVTFYYSYEFFEE